MLAVECGAAGTFPRKKAVPHKHTGREVFTGHPIGAEEVVAYYYGKLVFSDLVRQKQLKNTYGEAVMAVTVEHSLKWAFKNSDTVVDGRGVE